MSNPVSGALGFTPKYVIFSRSNTTPMSSQEEELKKYLAKRDRKRNRTHVVDNNEREASQAEVKKRDVEGFTMLFELSGGQSRWLVVIFVAIAVCIGLAVLLNYISDDVGQNIKIVGATFVLINLLFFWNIYRKLDKYKLLVSGTDYPVIAWKQFLLSRDDGFWNGGNYAYMSILFHQDQTWINEWGYRYKNAGKWTYGTPKEFNRIGADRIEGHANLSNGIPFVMNQLMIKLPELLKILTPGSLRITINTIGPDLSTSIDDSEEREEERRSDQRHREMIERED